METIRIHVKYFSFLKDIIGKSDEYILLEKPSVKGLIDLLEKEYSSISEKLPFKRKFSGNRLEVMVIVNGKVANLDYLLKNNDNVSLLPPMAGG